VKQKQLRVSQGKHGYYGLLGFIFRIVISAARVVKPLAVICASHVVTFRGSVVLSSGAPMILYIPILSNGCMRVAPLSPAAQSAGIYGSVGQPLFCGFGLPGCNPCKT